MVLVKRLLYCRVRDGDYAGRNFDHLELRFEDASAGMTAGALALSLELSTTLLQGDALDPPCTLRGRGGAIWRTSGAQLDTEVCC